MVDEQPSPFYTSVSDGEPSNQNIDSTAQASTPSTKDTMGSAPANVSVPASRTPHFSQDASNHPLITEFTNLYHGALANAKKGKDDDARGQYSQMLKLYSQIAAAPNFHDMNKDIAHFCLQDVYDTLSRSTDPNVSKLSFGALIGVTAVLLILGGMLLSNPGLVGMATGYAIKNSEAPQWIGGPQAITIHGPTTIYLKELFTTPDKAPITILAAGAGTLDAVVSGDYATLVPKYGTKGTTRITLIASRNDKPSVTTKVPVDVAVY